MSSPAPVKKPYPFWLGGTQIALTLILIMMHTSSRCRRNYRSLHHPVRPKHEPSIASSSRFSPLDLTKVRLQASGDKRMIESIKKTVRTAGRQLLLSHPNKLPHIVSQASAVSLTAFPEHGCVRCLTQCVASGRTRRARSTSAQAKMRQLGNWL